MQLIGHIINLIIVVGLGKLILSLDSRLCSSFLGYVPGVDNFSHLGGFLMGLIVSLSDFYTYKFLQLGFVVRHYPIANYLHYQEAQTHCLVLTNSHDTTGDRSIRSAHTQFLHKRSIKRCVRNQTIGLPS